MAVVYVVLGKRAGEDEERYVVRVCRHGNVAHAVASKWQRRHPGSWVEVQRYYLGDAEPDTDPPPSKG